MSSALNLFGSLTPPLSLPPLEGGAAGALNGSFDYEEEAFSRDHASSGSKLPPPKHPQGKVTGDKKRGRITKGSALPSPPLISTDSPQQKELFLNDGTMLRLTFLGQGQFHKVWTIEKDPNWVIKTPLPSGGPEAMRRCAQMTKRNLVTIPGKTGGLYRLAQFVNDIFIDGYWKVERLDHEVNRDQVLERVATIFARMISNPDAFYVGDFHPTNLKADAAGNLVLIDPPPFDWNPDDNQFDIEEDLVRCIKAWDHDGDLVQLIDQAVRKASGETSWGRIHERLTDGQTEGSR